MATDQQRQAIAREIVAFDAMKAELLRHYEGQFALVKSGQLEGTFTTENEAYDAGVKKFGVDTFLVRPVIKDVPIAAMPALFAGLIDARL